MWSLRDQKARAAVVARIWQLTPQCERRWGELEAARLLPHLADALRLALRGCTADSVSKQAPFAAHRYEWIHERAWPEGGTKSPPQGFTTPPTVWEQDRALLLHLVAQFAATPGRELAAEHPLFGEMDEADWDVLMYRHLDHHLRQFGV
jgi:hypothetical protein